MTLLDDMLALLPDNTSGAISANNVRVIVTDLYNLALAKQPLDPNLTTIAGLTATTDNMIQSVGAAWASRTPAQVKTAIGLGNVDNVADASKPVSTAQQAALNFKADVASPTFTGTVGGITAGMVGAQPLDADLTTIAALTATTDNMIQSVGNAWASRTPAQVRTALAVAPTDSPTFTGTITAARSVTPSVTLTDAATIATDAALGNIFEVTLAASRALGAPTNPLKDQRALWRFIQNGTGGWTITLNAIFNVTFIGGAPVLAAGAGKISYMGAIYNGTRWDVLAFGFES